MIIDSGASEHVVPNKDYMSDIQNVPRLAVELTNGAIAKLTNMGTVVVDTGGGRILLTRVYYIPNIMLNLLPCSRLYEKRVST